MTDFIPESPKIKYIIPKIRPTSFSLNEGETNENDTYDNYKYDYYHDFNNEKEDDEHDSNNNIEKYLDDLGENSIYKTLLFMRKRNESNSSIETKDSM